MALSAFAVLNPSAIGAEVATLKSSIHFPWEQIEHPDLGCEQNPSPMLIDLQSDSVEAVRIFASKFDQLPWGFGILVDDSKNLRKMRQHLRAISHVRDCTGQSRNWFWSDPRYVQALLPHIKDPISAALFFGESQTYVTVYKNEVCCFQWDGAKVLVIQR